MQPTCFPLWIFHWGELCCHLILIRWFTVAKKIYMLPTWRSLSVYRYVFISSEEAQAFIPACLDKIWLSSYFKRITLYEFHIVTVTDSTVHGFITNQHIDQLPGSLGAQMVEHCTGIAEVMHGFCLSNVHYCEDRFHIQYYAIVRATSISHSFDGLSRKRVSAWLQSWQEFLYVYFLSGGHPWKQFNKLLLSF